MERHLETNGSLVTAVRCDRVVGPSVHDPSGSVRALPSVRTRGTGLHGSPASGLVADTMATARTSLGLLESTITRVALRFREDPLAASRELGELVQAVRALTVLTGAMADVITLETGRHSTVHASDITNPVGAALRSLLAWQTLEDWNRTALCLEEDLRPAIRRWHELFDRLEALREAA